MSRQPSAVAEVHRGRQDIRLAEHSFTVSELEEHQSARASCPNHEDKGTDVDCNALVRTASAKSSGGPAGLYVVDKTAHPSGRETTEEIGGALIQKHYAGS